MSAWTSAGCEDLSVPYPGLKISLFQMGGYFWYMNIFFFQQLESAEWFSSTSVWQVTKGGRKTETGGTASQIVSIGCVLNHKHFLCCHLSYQSGFVLCYVVSMSLPSVICGHLFMFLIVFSAIWVKISQRWIFLRNGIISRRPSRFGIFNLNMTLNAMSKYSVVGLL